MEIYLGMAKESQAAGLVYKLFETLTKSSSRFKFQFLLLMNFLCHRRKIYPLQQTYHENGQLVYNSASKPCNSRGFLTIRH